MDDVWEHNEQTEKLLGLFKKLYMKVKYSTLDQLDMPFIFAFSAHVDTHVVYKCGEAGFDSCFDDKLGPPKLLEIINEYFLN